mmetsp:Transcript_42749/g.81754  ORF Transcript_42749/g.81754 Transcript_42749/m.81754 type:complete len:679 (+) Transcript_42749:135-2171(+)
MNSLKLQAWKRSASSFWTDDVASEVGADDIGDAPMRRMGTMVSIFPNRKAMREQMNEKMATPRPVYNKYKRTGFAQWIARHPRFEQVTLLMITLNAIWIAIDTDNNKAAVLLDARPLFQVAEHLFCAFFLYEWTVRFLAFNWKIYALRDAWFLFDSLLVSTMVLETWIMTMLVLSTSSNGSAGLGNASLLRVARLLRLTRMARMARLLRAMPELLILIKGMVASLRSVFFTLGLLFVIVYIFAIAFTQICGETDCEVLFPDVAYSMHTLFLNGAMMDNLSSMTVPLMEQNLGLLFLFYTFVLLAALTMMNMLVGVICEVVSDVARHERESATLNYVNDKIKELVGKISNADVDGDDKISKDEFMKLLREKDALFILSEVGVDVMSLYDLADTIFDLDGEELGETDSHPGLNKLITPGNKKKIDFGEFMRIILALRGTNQASFKDVTELRKWMKGQFTSLDQRFHDLESAQRRSVKCTTQQTASALRPQWHHQHDGAHSVKPAIVSHCHGMSEESALQEAAQEFQRCLADSLDNLLDVHRRALASCRAHVVHAQQQQQQQEEQHGRRSSTQSVRWASELEECNPDSEAMRAISIPGICNANDEETSSTSPEPLSPARVVPATPSGCSPMGRQSTDPLWKVSLCRVSSGLAKSAPHSQVSEEVNTGATSLPVSRARPRPL